MEASGQLHAPAALSSGKERPWYSLERRLGVGTNADLDALYRWAILATFCFISYV